MVIPTPTLLAAIPVEHTGKATHKRFLRRGRTRGVPSRMPPLRGLFPSLRFCLTEIALSDVAKNAAQIPYALCPVAAESATPAEAPAGVESTPAP